MSLNYFTSFSCLEQPHHGAGTYLRWQGWGEICSVAKHSIKNICRAEVDVKSHTQNIANTTTEATNFFRSNN